MIGEEITDRGFFSASILPQRSHRNVDLIIRVPEGTPGAYIKKASLYPEELEFVLLKPRMRIVDVEHFRPQSEYEKFISTVEIIK
jgi:hypothetical protein